MAIWNFISCGGEEVVTYEELHTNVGSFINLPPITIRRFYQREKNYSGFPGKFRSSLHQWSIINNDSWLGLPLVVFKTELTPCSRNSDSVQLVRTPAPFMEPWGPLLCPKQSYYCNPSCTKRTQITPPPCSVTAILRSPSHLSINPYVVTSFQIFRLKCCTFFPRPLRTQNIPSTNLPGLTNYYAFT